MGEGIKITAKIAKKSKTNKGILIEGNDAWFSIAEKLVGFVEKLNPGDSVELTYIKKGTFQNVIGIYPAKGEVKEEPKEEKKGTGFNCTECGAELKDGKYKRCFNCNKKAKENSVTEKEPVTTTGTQVFDEPQKEKEGWKPGKSNYGSPEDIAGKEVGCAANCAAAILAGRPEDPGALLELWRTLFNGILEHIKLSK